MRTFPTGTITGTGTIDTGTEKRSKSGLAWRWRWFGLAYKTSIAREALVARLGLLPFLE